MTRADILLVERGHFPSRAKAREAIEAGLVSADGHIIRKPADTIGPDAQIAATAPYPWVSRGGVKLAAALEHFGFDPAGRIALDIGASTGGFTDVLLTRGASRVHAIDVGHGQLHARLASDPRVKTREGTDIRTLTREMLEGDLPSLIVIDVSFISLALVLPGALALAADDARLIALIKPQFEAGRAALKKGIVRDEAVREAACANIAGLVVQLGWRVDGIMPSPVAGGDGNLEFLLGATLLQREIY